MEISSHHSFLDGENFVVFCYSLLYLALIGLAFLVFLARCWIGRKDNWFRAVIASSVIGDNEPPSSRAYVFYFVFLCCNFLFPSIGLASRILWELDHMSFLTFGVFQTLAAGFVFCPIFIFALYSVQWEYMGSGVKPNLSLEEKQSYLAFALKKALIFTGCLVLMNGIEVWFWNRSRSFYHVTQNALLTNIILNIVLFFLCIQRYQLTRRGQYRAEKMHLYFNDSAKYHSILKAHLDYYQPPAEFIQQLTGLEQTDEEIVNFVAERIDRSLNRIRLASSRNIELINKTSNEGELVPLGPRKNLLNKCFIIVLAGITCVTALVSFVAVILFTNLADDHWKTVWLTLTCLILDSNHVIYTLVVCPMMYFIIRDKDIWGNHMSFDCSIDSPGMSPNTVGSRNKAVTENAQINNNPSITLQVLQRSKDNDSNDEA